MTAPVLLWLRRDLRLADQPALAAAMQEGPVVPVYVLDDETPRHRRMGAASRWWLYHSLKDIDAQLRARGSRLILARGAVHETLPRLAAETGANVVHAMRHHEPWWRNAERAVDKSLNLRLHDGNYLHPPGLLRNGAGEPYRIFTPFSRALAAYLPPPFPRVAPGHIAAPERWPASDNLSDWGLLPSRPDWASGFSDMWTLGEAGAQARLAAFEDHASSYGETRNLPSVDGSSRLSPHLHFGEISAAAAWHGAGSAGAGVEDYRRELVWRDYAQNVLQAWPDYARVNGKAQFDAMPWRDHEGEAAEDLAAWQVGITGYPIVDAGMRQLWATGWMHNRVRMIAASFLVKHLLIDWRVGEQWFWDTLVDADHANNAVNWQWTAGSGVDANMFGRIMAPLLQSEKFAAAPYIRRWVPELGHLPDSTIHDPQGYNCRPPDYPAPIVGHRAARERALAAYGIMRA